jgi:putative tricarboxylic transport membrane protein
MKVSDSVVGAGFVVAGALIIAETLKFPTLEGGQPGPALFPRILAGLMIIFGALVSIQGLRARDTSDKVAWRELYRNPGFINALFVLGAVVSYILFVEQVGFLITATLVTFVLMLRLRVRLLLALVVSIVFTNLVYLLFAKILLVPLATGLLWW